MKDQVRVTNKEWLRVIYHHMNLWSGLSSVSRVFPGAVPRSLGQDDLQTILTGNTKYLLSQKADGQRCLLLAFMYRQHPRAFFITRMLDVFVAPLQGTGFLFKGTLVDGEFMEESKFLAFDLFAFAGVRCGGFDFMTRLDVLQIALDHAKWGATLRLEMKPFADLPVILRLLGQPAKFKTDGLLFHPVAHPTTPGCDRGFFKWKRVYTLDFRVKVRNRDSEKLEVSLWVSRQKSGRFEEIEWDRALWACSDVPVQDNKIGECAWRFGLGLSPSWPDRPCSLAQGSWVLVKMRTEDKRWPNTEETVRETEKQIHENLDEDRLRSLMVLAMSQRKIL